VNRLPDISETCVNKEFGMGSRQENIELIKKVEKSREVRQLPKTIPLWGIWNTVRSMSDDNQVKRKRVSFLREDECE